MRMDKSQRAWAFASLMFFLASAVGYAIYALNVSPRPSGGSAVGLFFGIVGFGFMIFAALLGARKRVPVWRLGRAQGHVHRTACGDRSGDYELQEVSAIGCHADSRAALPF